MNFFARAAFLLALLSPLTPSMVSATEFYPERDGLPQATSSSFASAGKPRWITVARRYMGTNPTNRRSLWCADFMNLVLERSGLKGTASSMARSFANYGRRLPGPRVGAIAVMSRGKNGGHVGIVTGIDERGNLRVISGNHGNRVAEATYPRSRVIAFVWPAG